MPARKLVRAVMAVALLVPLTTPARADAVADFYRNTTIRMIIGIAVGGSYDLMGRMVARQLPKYIPGNPRIVVENMPGASGRIATNYAYNVAPRDGSFVIAAQESIPLSQAMGEPEIRYDAAKFVWIGNPIDPLSVLTVWHTAGITSIEEAKSREVTIGATSTAGTNYLIPKMLNDLVGTRFKIITGYAGAAAVDLAMERGEVQGRGSGSWASYKSSHPQWISEKKLIPLVQMTLNRHPDIPAVPRLIDLATTEQARGVFELYSITSAIGRPLFAPPGIPEDRVAALRAAFDATVKDKEFLADAERNQLDIAPVPGPELQKLVERVLATPKQTVAELKAALSKN